MRNSVFLCIYIIYIYIYIYILIGSTNDTPPFPRNKKTHTLLSLLFGGFKDAKLPSRRAP